MILTRLTVQGFKSFADRTEFDFGPGLTIVVGPNGCGKSNVVDAIKWVLGEQSARSLRGTRMADVIFSGARSRKPSNLAEVSLTFDNSDGTLATDEAEVTVTRQLFRSGASEYLINNKNSRLKDVRDLFLDTGVGVDAYSVIEQGRVDVLLAASPVERRLIFEEAAGISKYKARRTEAERKLDRSRQNLLRLNDVIDEVEKQLRSVKLAAGKARNFQEYDARLRELRAAFSLAEYHQLQQTRAALLQRRGELDDALQARRTELAASDARAAELEGELQGIDEHIHAGEADLARVQSELSAVTERIAQGRKRLVEYGEQRERLTGRAAELERQAVQFGERIDAERLGIETLGEQVRRHTTSIQQLEQEGAASRARLDAARKGLEQARTAGFEAARRESLLANQRSHLAQQRERLESEQRNHQTRAEALEQERISLQGKRAVQVQQVSELEQRGAELADSLRQVDEDLAAIEAERERLDGEIVAARESRSAVMSRLSTLEEMERRLEGVTEANRDLLAWRGQEGRTGGVIGLVADVLRIDNPRVVLLETLLSTFENAVVAESAYAFLSETSRRPAMAGTASVIALDRIPPIGSGKDFSDHAGYIGRVRDWVVCDARFNGLADHLLGRAVVADTVEHALAMADGAPEGFHFITLDGEMVSSDGRLAVGTTRGVSGLISRKTEIRQLRGQLDEIETQLEQVTRQRAELTQRGSDVELNRQGLLQQIAETQRRHGEARSQMARIEDDVERLERERSLLGGELHAVQRSLADLAREADRIDQELQSAVQAREESQAKVESLEAEAALAAQAAAGVAEALTAARVELGRATEKHTAATESLQRLEAQREQAMRDAEAARREVETAAERLTQLESETAQADRQREQQAAELERRRGELFEWRERRQAVRGRVEACGAQSRAMHAEIERADAAVHENAVEQREAEVRIETMTQRIAEELSIDLAAAYEAYEHEEQDWGAIKEEIETLRRKVERLGSVNLDAIRELEELTPRHEHLVEQRDDLLDSIGRLEALIDELNIESRERFGRTFDAIRDHFRELFRKLFGGGKADIILEDPEQPLECGIEIIARPPGKEPQSISLLSGGEKTMAAVALLLAVFKSKPSPFTILDEVDAALDEANNERFNTVVQEFLALSQFIIITHSKVTMHCADVLYGVTMQEAGVSKRVSVRFNEREPTPALA
jgi:chromosome segregation protein